MSIFMNLKGRTSHPVRAHKAPTFLLLLFLILLSACGDGNPVASEQKLIVQEPPIHVLSFSPVTGYAGTEITIIGENFSTMGTTVVFAGEVSARILSISSTSIVIEAPVGARSGKLKVKSGGQEAESQEEFIVKGLQITSFSPAKVKAGDTLIIRGSGFSPVLEENIVKIGPVQVQTIASGSHSRVISATRDSLKVQIPDEARTGKISVSVGGQIAESSTEVTVKQPPFTYKNCLVEVSGVQVQVRDSSFSSHYPYTTATTEVVDTVWKDFTINFDSSPYPEIFFSDGAWIRKGFLDSSVLVPQPIRNEFVFDKTSPSPSEYTVQNNIKISMLLDTVTFNILSFSYKNITFSISNGNTKGYGNSSLFSEGGGITKLPGNGFIYEITGSELCNWLTNVVYTTNNQTSHPAYGYHWSSIVTLIYRCTPDAKIRITLLP